MPPEAEAEALPVEAPEQLTFTWEFIMLMGGGSTMVIVPVPLQPLLSVTVTVYIPALRLLIEDPD